jgi:prepilin-type N-terminal cleavage/methylation domain-containing protein
MMNQLSANVSSGVRQRGNFSGYGEAGFTLIELIVVIGVVVVLMAVTVPNFTSWRANSKLRSSSSNIFSHLNLARIEAGKRQENIVVSFSTAANSAGWGTGSYLVFVDDGGTTGTADNLEYEGDEELLLFDANNASKRLRMPAGVNLYSAEFLNLNPPPASPVTAVGFNPRGLPLTNTDGVTYEGVKIKNDNSRYYRILVSPAGVISTQFSTNGTTWQ